jgi:hypothetical protein
LIFYPKSLSEYISTIRFGTLSRSVLILAATLIGAGCSGLSAADGAGYAGIIGLEVRWLAGLQVPNGAIPMTAGENGMVTVNPYFAN